MEHRSGRKGRRVAATNRDVELTCEALRGGTDRRSRPLQVAEVCEADARGGGRGARDGKRVEVQAHLADVGLALADGGDAAAGGHRGRVEVGAVLGKRVPATRRDCPD